MRFPSLKSRKSSNGPSTGTSTAVASTDEQLSSQASGGSSLSRWKSGISSVDEHGVLTSTAASPSAPASTSTSSAATAPSGKRSFFRRKSHSRSQSAGSQGMLDGTHTQSDSHPHATAPNGGHPLRQLTLPSELESTPHRSKRPGLSFSKRGFTATDVSSTHSRDAPRKSIGSASYGPSSPQSYSETLDARPPSRTNELSASSSSESFQLKSFRSVTAVREEPTLSSLVDAELTHSPISTRPSSPSAVPHTSLSTSSYFDSRPTSTASTTRVPSTPSGSISVSRFREAKAARSNSSLNSNASHTTAQRQTSGLKLDLPPRISLEYSPRPSLSIVQPDTQERPTSRPTSPLNDADGGPLSRASSSSPSHESYTTALHTLHASPPRVASPSIMQRSLSPSIVSHDERQPVVHPLAMHPDNALPLPPVPVDPYQQPRQHRRSQSGQSISSLSASLGGWFNSTSANLGISFSADDVHKAFAEKAAALRSRTPSIKDGIGLHSDSPKQGKLSQSQPEEEIIASPAESGPTREELAILLGGKILPLPPSATGDDYDPRSELVKPTSPKTPLSRASSFSNLGFGSNLFTNALTRIARPAQDDDQDSEDSHDVSVAKAAPVKVPSNVRKHAGAGNAFDTSSTSSDQDNEEEEVDSDDSEAQKRERERSLVFPPPRPTDEADRQRIYRAALTPPVLTPQGSSSDLRAYAQPIPPVVPLTSTNMKALDTGSDDDEDVPLSTLKIRAQSEVGLRSPLLTQAHGNRLSSIPYGGSAIGVSGTSTTGGQHQSRHDKHASTTSLHVPSSAGMPRSLSTFSTHVCEAGTSRQLQARSASSHAIPTMGSTGGLPRHVSLSSLIEFEQGRLQAALPSVQKSLGPASSRPSNSSDGSSSYPPTPTDGATRVGSLSIPPKTKHFSPTREVQQARNDSSKSGAFSDRSKARQRQEARNSGMVLGGSLPTSLASTSTAPLSFGWPTSSPQALQGMPAPAGIDAALYNSLPPDQKLYLQIRAQQLNSAMQDLLLQAQRGTLPNTLPTSPSRPLKNTMYAPLPTEMQMPMMGSTIPAFPPFSNMFGMPTGCSQHLPNFCNIPTSGLYTTQQSPISAASATGQPPPVQQAGVHMNNVDIPGASSAQHARSRSR